MGRNENPQNGKVSRRALFVYGHPTSASLQVVIGVSMMTVCAYAVKQLVGPYASKIYHRLYGHADADDLAAAQAKQEDSKVAEVVASAIHSQVVQLSPPSCRSQSTTISPVIP